MAFRDNPNDGPTPLAWGHTKCFGCFHEIEGAAVTYDGFGNNTKVSIAMHPKCANEMGQRLIMDSWPNRRKDPRFEKASS